MNEPSATSATDSHRLDAVLADAFGPESGSKPLGPVHPESPLGDFRLVREIGRGGMGIVYEAVQISLGRRVALKILPFAATLDPKQLQRFKNEAQAAAHLQHQHIVPVYGVGCERGVHYYAMQFVDGQPLDAVIDSLLERRAATGEAAAKTAAQRNTGTGFSLLEASPTAFIRRVAELGRQAADALEHAHQRGVLHRDVKPANLMLDERGDLWITDFGLARLPGDHGLTQTGDMMGTLRYMSPEQTQARPVLVDHRTDIYSLGVSLYELMTLTPAFQGHDRHELLLAIASREPPPPRRLNPAVPPELETIVLKAMAKNPEDRYGTAQEFADDLGRLLRDEPIRARGPTPWQKIKRRARRHRAVVLTAATASAVSLVLAVIGLAVSTLLISRERDRKEAALKEAKASELAADGARAAAVASAGEANDQRGRAEGLAADLHRQLVRRTVAHGTAFMDQGDPVAALPWLADALRRDASDPPRAEAHRFRLAATLQQLPRLVGAWFHDAPVTCADFSPDGRRVVTASRDHTARVWWVHSGEPVCPPLQHAALVTFACFSPDGQRILTGSYDQTACVWEAATGRLLARMQPGGWLTHASFSPDGTRVATACANGTGRVWMATNGDPVTPELKHAWKVGHITFSPDGKHVLTASNLYTPPGTHEGEARVWDAASGEPVTPPLAPGSGVPHAWFSPDGGRVLTANTFGDARVWEVPSGRLLATLAGSRAEGAAFSPDGKRIFTWNQYGVSQFWDAETGKAASSPLKHASSLAHAAFSADGRIVATACLDGTVRLWGGPGVRLIKPPLYCGGPVLHASFSRDGSRLVTASADHSARVFDLDGRPPHLPAHTARGARASFSPDGGRVLAIGGPGPDSVWDIATGRTVPLQHSSAYARHAAFSPDGGQALVALADGSATVFDTATGAAVCATIKHEGVVWHGSFSPDGKKLATAGRDGVARVWRLPTGDPITPPLRHAVGGSVYRASFSPNGERLVTGGDDRAARVWDAATGENLAVLQTSGAVEDATFSPDGRWIVTASIDGTARVWDAATGQAVSPPMRHGGAVSRASFSPNSRWVVTASRDATARVWDAATGIPVTPFLQHGLGVGVAIFSPDGRRVLTASRDCTARLWDATTGEPLTPPLRHLTFVDDAAFSPDGRRLVTACADYTIRVWDLPTDDRPVSDLSLLADLLSARRMDAKGELVRLDPTDLRAAWTTLHAKYPGEFAVAPGPTLLTPSPGAVVENGVVDRTKKLRWDFSWSEVEGATRYHLLVFGPRKPRPLVSLFTLPAPGYRYEASGHVPQDSRDGWSWKVRALVQGVWTDWSAEQTFEVAPLSAK